MTKTAEVLIAVETERKAQDAKWGEQNHPDGDVAPWAQRLAQQKKDACGRAAKAGTLTWKNILDEEVAEAYAATRPSELRAELIQVAAVAVAWVEAIDRRWGR